VRHMHLTIRLSGKRVRCQQTKLLYLNHDHPLGLNEIDPRSPLEPLVGRPLNFATRDSFSLVPTNYRCY
jgi:hypothetical protein